MSLGKELLLSCIVIMHISSMISQPVKRQTRNMSVMSLLLCNLNMAEKDYVKYMFGEEPKHNELSPLAGITRPVGNTTEENQTMCAIIDYLDNHVPEIINSSHLINKHKEDLITNITAFNTQFKAIGQNNACAQKSNHKTSDDYTMKVDGYRMIYFSRDWVEQYINTTAASC